MRKLAILLTVIMTVTLCGGLNAAAYTIERGIEEEADVIIISGQADSAVTITALEAGTDKDAINAGAIYLTEIVQPDSKGAYSLQWLPLEDGVFDIYVSNGSSFEKTENYYYFKENTKNNLLTMLQTYTVAQMMEAEIFAKAINMRALEQDLELYDTIADKDSIAEAMYVIREGLTQMQTESIADYIPMALLQAELQENIDAGNTDALLKEFTSLEDSFTLESFYQTNLTSATKAAVGSLIAENLPLSLEDLSEKTKEAIILAGINNESNWAGIRKYMELLEYDEYDNSSKQDAIDKLIVSAVKSSEIESISALKTVVDDAIENLEDSSKSLSGSSSGSFGGGSSGGSFGGSFSGTTSAVSGETIASVNVNELAEQQTDNENVVFSDVFESDWYYDAVNYLRWKGIVQGYLNNFYPQNNVTRAELVTMLKNAFGAESEAEESVSFGDVMAEDWFYADVTAAAKAGLVNGDGENFYPNDFVTRQDMAVMLKRFAENSGVVFETESQSFADGGVIADYAFDAVATLAGNGVIQGMGDNRFEPLNNATRGEIAQVIYRIVYQK